MKNKALVSSQDLEDLSSTADKQWFVIYTKPRREAIAQVNLERQGYVTYFPRVAITKRRGGELTTVVEPFFPRYIFIHLDPQRDNWAPIRFTRGVSGLVRFNGQPKAVDLCLINALKANENSEQLQALSPSAWHKGEVVEIERGPFSGYRCIFQHQRSSDRVSVLLNIVGQPTNTILDRGDLQVPRQF